jgi:hypothetical protein
MGRAVTQVPSFSESQWRSRQGSADLAEVEQEQDLRRIPAMAVAVQGHCDTAERLRPSERSWRFFAKTAATEFVAL